MQFQAPPALGNQYEDDSVLRSYLRRKIPAEVLREIEPTLVEMGRLAGGELYQMQFATGLTSRGSRNGTPGEIESIELS